MFAQSHIRNDKYFRCENNNHETSLSISHRCNTWLIILASYSSSNANINFVSLDLEEAARDFATKSRRRLTQMLAHPGSRSQGILGARTFVSRPKTLPLHSGKAKRVNPSVPLTVPSLRTRFSVPATLVRTKTSSRGSQIGGCDMPLIASAIGSVHSLVERALRTK